MVKVSYKCPKDHITSKYVEAGKVDSVIKCECGEQAVRCFNNIEVCSVTTEESRAATDLILYGNLPSGKAKDIF